MGVKRVHRILPPQLLLPQKSWAGTVVALSSRVRLGRQLAPDSPTDRRRRNSVLQIPANYGHFRNAHGTLGCEWIHNSAFAAYLWRQASPSRWGRLCRSHAGFALGFSAGIGRTRHRFFGQREASRDPLRTLGFPSRDKVGPKGCRMGGRGNGARGRDGRSNRPPLSFATARPSDSINATPDE